MKEESDSVDTCRIKIESENSRARLDKTLSFLRKDLSRARIQGLIRQGRVKVNGLACFSASKRLLAGDVVELSVPAPVAADPAAEDIPIDVVYEDDDLLVINKPAGIVVHPGAGNREGTLVNALLHYCADSLSGINGVLRPGIVHRLDKDTSGLMLVAKNDKAHKSLARQLEERTLSRKYKALIFKIPFPAKGMVDKPLGRHPSSRLKMAVIKQRGKEARTRYRVEKTFGKAVALAACELETGRTHQIRVHMNHIGHPVIGDPLYGPQKSALASALRKEGFSLEKVEKILAFSRQALHAGSISFIHPVTGKDMTFDVSMPRDMQDLLTLLSAP